MNGVLARWSARRDLERIRHAERVSAWYYWESVTTEVKRGWGSGWLLLYGSETAVLAFGLALPPEDRKMLATTEGASTSFAIIRRSGYVARALARCGTFVGPRDLDSVHGIRVLEAGPLFDVRLERDWRALVDAIGRDLYAGAP